MNPLGKLSRAGGFTLVEILLALGIAALLLTSLVTILSRSLDISKQANSSMYTRSSAQAALDLIAADLDSLTIGRNSGEILKITTNPLGVMTNHALYLVSTSLNDSYGASNGPSLAGAPVAIEYVIGEATNYASSKEKIIGLYRNVMDPTNTLQNSLGRGDLAAAFVNSSSNFVVPNAVAFQVRLYTNHGGGLWTNDSEPMMSVGATNFPSDVVVEVSLTVIDESVMARFRKATASATDAKAISAILNRFGRTMIRRVALPSPP